MNRTERSEYENATAKVQTTFAVAGSLLLKTLVGAASIVGGVVIADDDVSLHAGFDQPVVSDRRIGNLDTDSRSAV